MTVCASSRKESLTKVMTHGGDNPVILCYLSSFRYIWKSVKSKSTILKLFTHKRSDIYHNFWHPCEILNGEIQIYSQPSFRQNEFQNVTTPIILFFRWHLTVRDSDRLKHMLYDNRQFNE